MEEPCPSLIQERHRARDAAVYVRQSSAQQVVKNIGSAFHQRDLVKLAVGWGWPEHAARHFEDLGLSGAAAEHRGAYQELVRAIEKDEIGILLIADFSRGGRDDLEWRQLLDLCRIRDVLIWADSRLYDLQNIGDSLTARVLSAVAQHDNDTRRAAMIRGRDAKAERGLPVGAPPAGYIRNEAGRWEKDLSPAVRNAMDAVFRSFRVGGTLRKSLDLLLEWDVRLPRRTRKGIRWKNPAIGLIQAIIKHPAYSGDLVYRRRCTDPTRGRGPKGRYRLRNTRPEEMIVFRDAHPAYISREEFQANQLRLEINSNHRGRGKVGKGPALIQSIFKCRKHRGRGFQPGYKPERRDGGQSYSYLCRGDYDTGGAQCVRLPGIKIDRPVVKLALARVSPLAVDQVRDEYERLRDDERGELYRVETELRAADQDITDLEYRYNQSDRGNRLVRRHLEAKLEKALQLRDNLKRRLESEKARRVDVDSSVFDDVKDLCRDIEKIFWAPTTTHIERKQVLRMLLEDVWVAEHKDEHVVLELNWKDGSPPTSCEVKLEPYIRRRIADMAGKLKPAEIAEALNAEGLRTKYDAPWTANAVWLVIRRLNRAEEASSQT